METGIQDRCRGMLRGLAAGDRNGRPIQMAVHLAESLADRGTFDPANVAGRYLQWYREGAFDTGPVSGRALQLMASGLPAQQAAAQVHREFGGQTAGCNPAHRAAPLSMLASLADEDLSRCATSAGAGVPPPDRGGFRGCAGGSFRAAVRFGPLPLLRMSIPYNDIESVEVGRTLLVEGWASTSGQLHHWTHEKAYRSFAPSTCSR
jgi:hypothetical protein